MTRYDLRRGAIVRARAEDVYPSIESGSVSLAIVDGPYGMGQAEWDRIKLDDLPAWYEPHLREIARCCAPSASLYLWNTAAGWARIDPVLRGLGWTFRALVTWEKTNPPSQKGCEDLRTWPDVTEVAGFYQREGLAPLGGPAQFIAYAAGESDRNEIRKWLHAERDRAGLKGDDLEEAVNEAGGKGNMICRHSFTESQWCLPTWEQWKALHVAWNTRGDPAGRPYLQRDRSRVYDLSQPADHEALRADHEALRAEYEALRAEYEALRAPFTLPPGVTNVWTAPMVAGRERLHAENGEALHPCQKPLAFYDRMIRASTRPGDLVLEPFGGTCRAAVACERMTPDDARRYLCIEPDEDGRDYIAAVLPAVRLDPTPRKPGQVALFAPAPVGDSP